MQANSALKPDSVRGAFVVTSADVTRPYLWVPFLLDRRIWGTDGVSLLSFPTEAKGSGWILPVGVKWSDIPTSGAEMVRFLNEKFHQPKSYQTEKGFYVIPEGSKEIGEMRIPPVYSVIRPVISHGSQNGAPSRARFNPSRLDAIRQGVGLHLQGDGSMDVFLELVQIDDTPKSPCHVFHPWREMKEGKDGKPKEVGHLDWVGFVSGVNAPTFEHQDYLGAIPTRPKAPEPPKVEAPAPAEAPLQGSLVLEGSAA